MPPRTRRNRQQSPVIDVPVGSDQQEAPVPVSVMTTSSQSSQSGPVIQAPDKLTIVRYNPTSLTVRADSWMNGFDFATDDKSDHQKVRLLFRYLDGDAINWFSDEIIPALDMMTWSTCRELFLKRFGIIYTSPIVQAQKRILKKSEVVNTYYLEKMYLLRKTTLSEAHMVDLLTDGMPIEYKKQLISAQVTATSTWLAIASQLEASLISFRNVPSFPQRSIVTAVTNSGMKPSGSRESKKPPQPCKFCLEKGKEEWHWHNECPLKGHERQAKDKATYPKMFTLSDPKN